MELGFEETQAAYDSGSQTARVWSEKWVARWMYCPNCGNSQLNQFPANLPVADFYCASCNDQFELKCQKKKFGKKLANGAYTTKIERLNSDTSPNLILMNYDKDAAVVRNIFFVPKHFFVPSIVEKRNPLASTARRAGWVGSNILLNRIPEIGRIYGVKDGHEIPKEFVLSKWKKTVFMRNKEVDARGWLLEVLGCVERLNKPEFSLQEIYQFENILRQTYPNNQNIRPKIRQQLQVLRDNGYLEFLGNGDYRVLG